MQEAQTVIKKTAMYNFGRGQPNSVRICQGFPDTNSALR